MSGLRLCRDCRFMKRGFLGLSPSRLDAKCTHHEVSPAIVDNVTGSTKPRLLYCTAARSHSRCGPDGKLWSPRGAA